MRLTFKGGVHPPYRKYTSENPIKEIGIPEEVIIPLSQHTGAPAKPLVDRGASVYKGTKIGELQGFISANVHSPTSGKVKRVFEWPHPVALKSLPAIIIEPDGEDTLDENIKEDADYLNASPQEIVERVKEAGIVGMGGAAFPTHVKLSPPKEKPIDTLIINGAECEPYLTADDRLMREHADEIIQGAYLILKAVGAKRGFIAIEDNKPEAIEAMERAVRDFPDFEVAVMKTKYPEGAEKQLIWALTRRQVPSGGLPMDVGALVQNVGTSRAVYHAVRYRMPLIERVTTLTGGAPANPGNYLVRIGTKVEDFLKMAGDLAEEPVKAIMGGPMMGIAQYTLDVPILKGTSGVLLMTAREVELPRERDCIRCGRCVEVCPMFLYPTRMAYLIKNKRFEEAREIGVLDCIECGSCSYVCPARIPLVQYFKYAKAELRLLAQKA